MILNHKFTSTPGSVTLTQHIRVTFSLFFRACQFAIIRIFSPQPPVFKYQILRVKRLLNSKCVSNVKCVSNSKLVIRIIFRWADSPHMAHHPSRCQHPACHYHFLDPKKKPSSTRASDFVFCQKLHSCMFCMTLYVFQGIVCRAGSSLWNTFCCAVATFLIFAIIGLNMPSLNSFNLFSLPSSTEQVNALQTLSYPLILRGAHIVCSSWTLWKLFSCNPILCWQHAVNGVGLPICKHIRVIIALILGRFAFIDPIRAQSRMHSTTTAWQPGGSSIHPTFQNWRIAELQLWCLPR